MAIKKQKSHKVLLADDVEVNRIVFEGLLRSAGFDVDVVCDGQSAVGALACGHYDLILMDIDMPGVDGHSASSFIRKMGAVKGNVPIVALSGKNDPTDIKRSLDAGMNDHIVRPIEPKAFVAKITRMLEEFSLRT